MGGLVAFAVGQSARSRIVAGGPDVVGAAVVGAAVAMLSGCGPGASTIRLWWVA